MAKLQSTENGPKAALSLPLGFFGTTRVTSKRKSKPFVYKAAKKDKLIDVASLGVKPQKKDGQAPQIAPAAFSEIDKMISATEAASSQKPAAAADLRLSELPKNIALGKIGPSASRQLVEDKYSTAGLPLPKSKRALRLAVQPLLPIVPKLLSGEEPSSIYYTLALQQRRKLPNATMSLQERWDISWVNFIGGFYGLQRQLYISLLIQEQYSDVLRKSKNKTVAYWLPDMFSTYVLANEIIIRLVMADLDISMAKAEAFLRDTVDYGCHVADEIELQDDLDFESSP